MPALEIGSPAPSFVFRDDNGTERTIAEFRGGPLIVAFAPAQRLHQASFQHLMFEGERLPLIAPTDDVADRYGVASQYAVFVIGSNGAVAWRYAAGDAELAQPSVSTLSGLSRREFIAAMLAASIAASFASSKLNAFTPAETPSQPAEMMDITFVVNGRQARLAVDPRVTLLDALREHLELTGTKKGCDHGQCGACTVHVDGRRVLSCLTLAATVQGRAITTIEGLAQDDRLHPLQQAFIDHDGFQCGYCTAGQIMSAVALLQEPCGPGDDDVRECMSGNICRCGAYPGIVAAVQAVRRDRS